MQIPGNRRSVNPDARIAGVRIASGNDLVFITSLQRKFANQIGFLPRVAVEELVEEQAIKLALENEEPAGFIASRSRLKWCPQMRSITQAAVCFDAQRRHHGLALLQFIEQEAAAAGQLALQACCREGLDANEFWKAAGFRAIAHLTPATARNREIIVWRKPLARLMPIWFAMLPDRAGYRAKKPINTPTTRRIPRAQADKDSA